MLNRDINKLKKQYKKESKSLRKDKSTAVAQLNLDQFVLNLCFMRDLLLLTEEDYDILENVKLTSINLAVVEYMQ